MTPDHIDRTAQEMDGDLAEAAIWNIALSDADVARLATGESPLSVRPDALVDVDRTRRVSRTGAIA